MRAKRSPLEALVSEVVIKATIDHTWDKWRSSQGNDATCNPCGATHQDGQRNATLPRPALYSRVIPSAHSPSRET